MSRKRAQEFHKRLLKGKLVYSGVEHHLAPLVARKKAVVLKGSCRFFLAGFMMVKGLSLNGSVKINLVHNVGFSV